MHTSLFLESKPGQGSEIGRHVYSQNQDMAVKN